MKEKYPRDHMYLRNATVQYYRSKIEFVLEDYLDDIIRPYEPEDNNLNIETLAKNINSLPERSKFDRRFIVIRESLKKRIIKRLPLTPQLELVIKENINWNQTVQAFEENGIKFIKIRTDKGFEHFKEAKS